MEGHNPAMGIIISVSGAKVKAGRAAITFRAANIDVDRAERL
jgi:hypothetical protein